MKLKTLVKLACIVSVSMFIIAAGYSALTQLEDAERSRDINLFGFVPDDCVSVLENENVNAYLNEMFQLNYGHELQSVSTSGLSGFILDGLSEYATVNAHGLSNGIRNMLVSYHELGDPGSQVVYFSMGQADQKTMIEILQGYAPSDFLPKEEDYRGKRVTVYPLASDEYLSTYSEDGCWVASFHKRLVERVIDARLDGTSLRDDELFQPTQDNRKSHSLLTLYTRTSIPFVSSGDSCWSSFDFHANSDVLYLTGRLYAPSTFKAAVDTGLLDEWSGFKKDSILITADKDSLQAYIDEVSEEEDRTLFGQCVANLSHEASLSMVVDMQHVAVDALRYEPCLPVVLLRHAPLLHPFVFSSQYILKEDGLSFIWIFTYKD